MRTLARLSFTALALVALLEGCFYINYKLKRSVDSPDGEIELHGLGAQATIRRDDLGIPLVEAESEEDLSFAVGYATASDRLWQMVVMKMLAQGRLAEIVGTDWLQADLFMRTLGIKRYSEQACTGLDPRIKMVLSRYAAGVNAYMKTHRHLPIEFSLTGYHPEPWQPQDSISIFGLLNLALSQNLGEELAFLLFSERFGYEQAAYLFPIYQDEPLPLVEAAKLAGIRLTEVRGGLEAASRAYGQVQALLTGGGPGSNNWAISGSRTSSGRAIVANDTHLLLSIPSFWMIMHARCPTYKAAGVAVAGIPMVVLGFNGRLAWGATMVMADSIDIFLEKLEHVDGKPCYLYQGGCLPLIEREETFLVKGKKAVTRTIRETMHGPLLNEALEGFESLLDIPGPAIPVKTSYGLALRWSFADGERGITSVYDFASAKNVREVQEALSRVDSIYLNVVCSDGHDIAWLVTGRIPKRKKGTGQFPSPGWTGEYDWEGYVPFEEKPYAINPGQGYLATANNRTVPAEAPLRMSSSWYGPERVDRIRELLMGMQRATHEEAMRMHADQYSPMARKTQQLLSQGRLASEVLGEIRRWQDHGRKSAALAALDMIGPGRFDCIVSPDSAAAALMGAFHHSFTRNAFLDELGPDDSLAWKTFIELNFLSYSAPEDHLLVRSESPFWGDARTGAARTKAEIIAESLADAYGLCEEHMGRDIAGWRWGKMHTYHWRHPAGEAAPILRGIFDRGPVKAGGDMHTINVAGYLWGKDFDVVFIPAMRMVVDFGLEDPAFLITHGGQSGDPASPHYADMIPPWVAVENHPLPFLEKNITRQYRHRLVLKPAED